MITTGKLRWHSSSSQRIAFCKPTSSCGHGVPNGNATSNVADGVVVVLPSRDYPPPNLFPSNSVRQLLKLKIHFKHCTTCSSPHADVLVPSGEFSACSPTCRSSSKFSSSSSNSSDSSTVGAANSLKRSHVKQWTITYKESLTLSLEHKGHEKDEADEFQSVHRFQSHFCFLRIDGPTSASAALENSTQHLYMMSSVYQRSIFLFTQVKLIGQELFSNHTRSN